MESGDDILKQRISLLFKQNYNLQTTYEDSLVNKFYSDNKIIYFKEGAFYKVYRYFKYTTGSYEGVSYPI